MKVDYKRHVARHVKSILFVSIVLLCSYVCTNIHGHMWHGGVRVGFKYGCDSRYNLSLLDPFNKPLLRPSICRRHDVFINPTMMEFKVRGRSGGDSANSPYISEKSKLVICWIPKNSCTKFKQLIIRLKNHHGSSWQNMSNVHLNNADLRVNRYPASILNEISSNDSWKRLAVVRDPIERFVSGYLDKVVRGCWFKDSNNNRCFQASIDDFLYFLRSDVWIDNDHFASQWRFCGFDHYPWFWNEFLLYHEKSISSSSMKSLSTHVNQSTLLSGWTDGAMFSSRIGHETSGSDIKTNLLAALCKDAEAIRLLHSRLQSDYVFFQFPMSTLCL